MFLQAEKGAPLLQRKEKPAPQMILGLNFSFAEHHGLEPSKPIK